MRAADLLGHSTISAQVLAGSELDELGVGADLASDDAELDFSGTRKPRGVTHRARAITLHELRKNFHLPINEVAAKLGLCVTVLKQRCREHGIKRWPYRKVRKLDTLISNLERQSSEVSEPMVCHVDNQRRKRLETARETRSFLLKCPNSAAHLKLGKAKLAPQKQAGKNALLADGHILPKLAGGASSCPSDSTIDNLNSGEVCDDFSAEVTENCIPGLKPTSLQQNATQHEQMIVKESYTRHIVEIDLLGTMEANERKFENDQFPSFPQSGSTTGSSHGTDSEMYPNAVAGTVGLMPLFDQRPRFEPLLPTTGALAHSERSAFQPLRRQSSSIASSNFGTLTNFSLRLESSFPVNHNGHSPPS